MFAGASAAEPIVVADLTPPPPPAVFDFQTGTVANVVAGSVSASSTTELPGDCVPEGGAPVADVTVAKVGPAVIQAGQRITYTLVINNAGPDPAATLVITDTLPPELTAVDAPGATSAPGPPPTVTWTVPELAAGASAQFVVSGTVPATGTLLNQASATATTSDSNPANNNGSTPAQQLTTTIQADAPTNAAPVVDDGTFSTIAAFPMTGSVPFADPDIGQSHLVALSDPPRVGFATVSPSGVFVYTPRFGFSGLDDFAVIVCDNGNPVLCDEGIMTIAVTPYAVADTAYTVVDMPVRIDVLHNDIGNSAAPAVLSPPSFGTAVADGNEIVYTPAAGFLGADEFDYVACAPDQPTICGNATVTVVVDEVPTSRRSPMTSR